MTVHGAIIASVLAVSIGLAGCGDGSSTTTTTAATPAYAQQLEATLQSVIDDSKVPAAAVVVRSASKGDWSKVFGTRTLGGTEPVTLDDRVRVGSNTKTMTGTVVLQLVDEGRLALDDPVSKYRPDVPDGQSITIAMLLEMRSGLYNYSADEGFNVRLDSDPTHVWHPDELLAIAFAHPPSFAPGAGFEYSNTNTVLLGLVVEQLTGMPLQEAFQQRIFGPLGLKATVLPALEDASIPTPHPRGYMFGTNAGTLADPALPPDEQAAAATGALAPNDVTDDSPSWTWAAGGVISTAGDLARYVEALVDGGLLSPERQAARLASIQPSDPSNPQSAGYGLGIAKFGPMIGHDGQIPGFNSFMGRDPEQRNTVIVWTSLFAAPNGQQPANELARAVIEALYS